MNLLKEYNKTSSNVSFEQWYKKNYPEKKEQYVSNLLNNEILNSEKQIDKLNNDVKSILDLPNDCYGIDIDGEICQNKDYKIDLLTNYHHQIGYYNGVIQTAKNMIMFNGFNIKDFEDFLIEQEKIKKHNDKVMSDLLKLMKNK